MANSRRFLGWSVVLALVFSGDAAADARYPIAVKNVQLGFPVFSKDPSKKATFHFKAGQWAPVWLDLELTDVISEEIEIRLGVPDGDDVICEVRYRIPAPSVGDHPASTFGAIPYLKPGGIATDVSVQIVGVSSGRPLIEPTRRRVSGLPPARFLFLSVGSSLPGFRIARTEGQAGDTNSESLRNGWVELASAGVEQLPDRWIGYDAVDLLILNTANEAFWQALGRDSTRTAAIIEWVRRGGRVIIDVGAAETIERIDPLRPLLGKFKVDNREVQETAFVLPNSPRLILKDPTGRPFRLSKFIPATFDEVLLTADELKSSPPLVVQYPLGLGRVTRVAFAVDRMPLSEWPQREAFWDWLVSVSTTRLPNGAEQIGSDEEDKYLTAQRNNLEFFEGVPLISFGWVALLLLGYILLIGPIEYLLLKRVLKRMELTWLTLPILVAVTCIATYFAARELKGDKLRINKVDLVDIDLAGSRVYGHTWFTLFSPANRNFTVGAEPAPDWYDGSTPTETLVSWYGKSRENRQSLFRRTYQDRKTGLEDVPIPIWSTKSFTGVWAADIPADRPLIESTLRQSSADPNLITGSITSRLPVEVVDEAHLLYRGSITPLPSLIRDLPRYISTSATATPATTWLQNAVVPRDLLPNSRTGKPKAGEEEGADDPRFRLWPMLFHELIQGQFNRLANASERELDQSWRVSEKNPRQAIVIIRLRRTEEPAETMAMSPRNPTRLNLSGPLAGTWRQETYIRVFIPILPSSK